MNRKIRIAGRILSVLMVCIGLIFACPKTASAEETIRIGYAELPFFTEGGADDAHKSGYAYEYIQKIALQNGWQYEYVYGTWTDLFNMLKKGEIDMMPGISYSEERSVYIDFPDYSMGTEYYYLYVDDQGPFANGELDQMRGKTVGVVQDSMEQSNMIDWNLAHQFECRIATYSNNRDLYTALENGDLDAIVDSEISVRPEDHLLPLVNVGHSEYYLAVSQSRNDLLLQLNQGLAELELTDPHYQEILHYRYFSKTDGRRTLTEEEEEWLAQHPVIRIGYEKNFLPFCAYDEKTGELKGALTVFVKALEESYSGYGVKVEVIPYDHLQDSMEALKRGKVDVVYPLYQSAYAAERSDLRLTRPIASTAMTAIVDDLSRFDEFADNTVAVANGFVDIDWFLSESYPNWTIKRYPSFEDCIDAVHAGDVDCVVESTYVYKTLVDYRTIQMVSLSQGAQASFAVGRDQKELFAVLNNAIARNINAEFVANLTRYANVERKTTFSDFAKDNILVLGICVLLLVLILAILLLRTRYSERKAKQAEAEKSKLFGEKEQQLKEIISLNIRIKQEKRRAEAANNAKTTFLFNMSHDIRTPMNAIIGFTDLIEQHIDDRQKIRDYIHKIQTSNTFLLSLINNVLEMAKIESGKMALDLVYWEVEEFNDTIYSVFSELMESSGLKFERSINVTHRAVMCDATKIREIFLNLLSNANKYTPAGGTVSMDLTELPCDREGYALYQTVITDNGIGMSQEYLGHIFDEFSRERTSTESHVAGSGLGMAIVKKLVEFMDGTIKVESESGEGTRITVTIPLLIANESDRPTVQEYEAHFDRERIQGKRILLAEDNALNAEIAITVLNDMGLIVDHVSDGVQCVDAFEKADADTYQLILMDIQMPNMNGYQAAERIRTLPDEKKSRIPIVAMTANAFAEDKQNAIRAGMNAHLAKPINIRELAMTIADLL